MFKSSYGWSSTGWETSHYGGYAKTLYDLPDIRAPYSVDIRLPYGGSSSLSYYNHQKLIKMVLQRCKDKIPTKNLLKGSTSSVERNPFGDEIKTLKVNKDSFIEVVDQVIEQETELKNLFAHYKKEITQATIVFELPSDTKSPEGECKRLLDKITEIKPKKSFESIMGEDAPKPEFIIQPEEHETRYHDHQKLLIKRLVNQLDINFDLTEDIICSLKHGKLDVSKLAEVLAHNDHVYERVEEDQKTKPFSVVILCDESGSMEYSGLLRKQHELVKILYGAFSEILPQDKISIYGHSGQSYPEIYVYHDKFNQSFDKTIDSMKTREHLENYDGPVIEAIYERVRQQTSDNILMIVISDGQPSGEDYGGQPAIDDLKRVIEKCKRDDFVIMGIGFHYGGVKELYSYHTIVDDMSTLVFNVTTLLNKVVKTEFQ